MLSRWNLCLFTHLMVDENNEVFIIDMSRMGYGHPIFDVMAVAAASVNLLVATVSLPVVVMASS